MLVENQRLIDALWQVVEGGSIANADLPLVDYDVTSKIYMVLGEGAIFLLLLLVGFYFLKKSFEKERQMRHTQQNFLFSVTHELNTPLAGIRLNLETIEKRDLNTDQIKSLSKGALEEVQRLNAMIKNILTAARLESSNAQAQFQPLNFSRIVEEVTNQLSKAYQMEVDISGVAENCTISGDENLIRTIPKNLIENGLKYGNGKVAVALSNKSGSVELTVTDNGPGIPPEEQKAVLGKFYRIQDERTRESKGTGLGLYLVNQVTQLHHGKWFFTFLPKGEFRVTVLLTAEAN
jgi:signal transduction histidine kinase